MLALTINPALTGIRVKSVNLPEDTDEVMALLKEEFYHPAWTFGPSTEEVEQSYGLLNAGDTSGAYFLQYNSRTVFLLEIVPVEETDNDDLYDAQPGDFFIRVIPGSHEELSHAADGLKACNEAILRNPLVKRILYPVKYPVLDRLLGEMLVSAGFTVLDGAEETTEQTDPENADRLLYTYS